MSGEWIILRTFDTAMDAFLARSLLEEHDILALVEDQHMASMYNPAVGGASLKVSRQDAEKALALLDE